MMMLHSSISRRKFVVVVEPDVVRVGRSCVMIYVRLKDDRDYANAVSVRKSDSMQKVCIRDACKVQANY